MICTNPSGDRRAYEVTEEEEENAQDRYGNQDVMVENLQYSFSNTFHTCHEDLEIEDPEEGEFDEAIGYFDTELREEPETEEKIQRTLSENSTLKKRTIKNPRREEGN